MSLTLKDLRAIREGFLMDSVIVARVLRATRPASLADLVEVLKQEGAETIWWCEAHNSKAASQIIQAKGMEPIGMCDWYSLTPSEGQERCRMVRRLVLPLGDTP